MRFSLFLAITLIAPAFVAVNVPLLSRDGGVAPATSSKNDALDGFEETVPGATSRDEDAFEDALEGFEETVPGATSRDEGAFEDALASSEGTFPGAAPIINDGATPHPAEGVIPPKSQDLRAAVVQVMENAREVINEVAWAIQETAKIAKEGDGTKMLDHMVTELLNNYAIPRAIWGVTTFQRSLFHQNVAAVTNISRLKKQKLEILQQVLGEYRKPAFQAPTTLMDKFRIAHGIVQSTFREQTTTSNNKWRLVRWVNSLYSWVAKAADKTGQQMGTLQTWFSKAVDTAYLWSDRLRKSSSRDNSITIVNQLVTISEYVENLTRKTRESVVPTDRSGWVKRLASLRAMVSLITATTITTKSEHMQLFEKECDQLLSSLLPSRQTVGSDHVEPLSVNPEAQPILA